MKKGSRACLLGLEETVFDELADKGIHLLHGDFCGILAAFGQFILQSRLIGSHPIDLKWIKIDLHNQTNITIIN